jgi:hypothetical protein
MRTALVMLTASLLTACTLVVMRGNGNTATDVGGHGGGVALPPHTEPSLLDRLQKN